MSILNVCFVFLPCPDNIVIVEYAQRFSDEPFVCDIVFTIDAQFDNLVTVQWEVDVRSPAEIIVLEVDRVQCDFNPLVTGFTYVVHDGFVTVHVRDRTAHQQVACVDHIHVDVTGKAAIEEAEVDTGIDRAWSFPFQVRVADPIGRQVRTVYNSTVVAPNIVCQFQTVKCLIRVDSLVTVRTPWQTDL